MSDDVQTAQSRNRDIDVFDYLAVLWSWRRFLVINVTVFALLSLGLLLLLPLWYKSTASILPPKEQGVLGQLGAASTLLKSISGSARLPSELSGTSSTYNYIAILKSRTVMESIVNEFDLRTVYDVPDSSMDRAIKELESNTEFDTQPEDNITVEVWDEDPQRAADIANAFVRLLNETSIRLATSEARNNRQFIGERLDSIKAALRSAEDALQGYQESSGLIIIPDENMAGLSAIADLYSLKVEKELELGMLRRIASPGNPAIRQIEAELDEINKKVAQIPQAGIESLRLFREVFIQQKMLEFVLPMYEQAKVDEQKTIPVILILDDARPSERHDKPKRLYLLLALGMLGLIVNMLAVFLLVSLSGRDPGSNPVASSFERFVGRIARAYRVG